MNRLHGRLTLRATAALVIAALHLNSLAQTLPPPPVSPAPVTTYEYDANGNPTKTTQAPGVSGFGFSTVNTYDTLDRLKDTTDARNGKASFGYDGLDRTTRITDPRNLVTQYPRNGLGDVTQLISPDTGTANHTYDPGGNLLTRTDSRGVKATFGYDALSRPTYVSYTGTGFSTETYGWVYDQVSTAITYGIGRLTGHDYPTGNVRYSYDPQGRPIAAYWQVFAQTGVNARVYKTTAYTYDGAGHVTSITYPSGRIVNYTYAQGQLTAISLKASASATAQNLLTQIHWQPFGPADGWLWQLNSGTKAYSRSYDLYRRQVRYPLGNVIRDLTYDAADRISSYTHYDATTASSQPSLNQSFGYDQLGRLTSVTTATSTWSIGYDPNGNRTSVTLNGTNSAYTTQATSNRLTGISNPARSFGYDNAGNTSSDSQGYTATYGASGQLASLTKAGTTTSYAYNTLSQRIRKTNGTTAGTTIYAYDVNSGNLLGEYDSNGNAIKEYVWLGNTPVAVFTSDPANVANPPITYYVYSDHLDAPRVIVDKNHNVRWRWLAEPFGSAAPENNPSSLGAFTFNLRFPGEYFDQESGLAYNVNRYVDTSNGRFTQYDPIGLAGGSWSPYVRVNNNPLSYVDPEGLQRVLPGPVPLPIPGPTPAPAQSPRPVDPTEPYGPLYTPAPGISLPDFLRPNQCPPENECDKLNADVQRAKEKVGSFQPAACNPHMTKGELVARASAWLELAVARAKSG